MIYTVTFNPALDYVVEVDDFIMGAVNRTTRESVYYGGKGINVSRVLNTLGLKTTALGFIAGFTGDEIERGVRSFGVDTDFIKLEEGMSRINVKLKSSKESEINGQGPVITTKAINSLFEKLDTIEDGSILVLSGSIPKTLSDDIYEVIMRRLEGRDIKIVVDATNDLLMNVLKYRPFLIKPNNHELEEIFRVEVKTVEDVAICAKKLQEMGAVNVLVSMAGDGALLLTEDGEEIRGLAPRGVVKNSVGAGDSMVAGFIAGYLENRDYNNALRLGTAAGSASAFSDDLASREYIEKIYKSL